MHFPYVTTAAVNVCKSTIPVATKDLSYTPNAIFTEYFPRVLQFFITFGHPAICRPRYPSKKYYAICEPTQIILVLAVNDSYQYEPAKIASRKWSTWWLISCVIYPRASPSTRLASEREKEKNWVVQLRRERYPDYRDPPDRPGNGSCDSTFEQCLGAFWWQYWFLFDGFWSSACLLFRWAIYRVCDGWLYVTLSTRWLGLGPFFGIN